jgi:hypothetical protein
LTLLYELAQRKDCTQIYVRKPGISVTLVKHSNTSG